jgi:alkylation response protein AidB-like acyl-CoA dehydrogenase
MLSPSQDQQLIRDSAARLVREAAAGKWPAPRDVTARVWESIVDMGWLALAVPEQDGGLGGSVADLCALAVELGHGLMVGSYTIGSILPGCFITAAPVSDLRSSLLTALLSGSRSLALADTLARGRDERVRLDARPGPSPGSWVLDGARTNVWAGDETRKLLVFADSGAGGAMLAIVDLDSPGVAAREFRTADGGSGLDCIFTGVRVPAAAVLAPPGESVREIREGAWDFASVVMVAECVGMMKSLIEQTAEHLRTRKQFGKPLAQFQVLRHRMADMALQARRAEVLGDRVARQFATFNPAERSRLVAAAGAKGLAGLRFVAEQSIQLHGGMGMTAELPVGHYLRRSIALEATFGSAEQHRIRFQESIA